MQVINVDIKAITIIIHIDVITVCRSLNSFDAVTEKNTASENESK